MRYAILLIMAFLCLTMFVYAQTPVTEKVITVKYQQIPLSFVLKDIQKRYAIHFSYTNNLLSLSKKISIDMKDASLKNILEILLDNTDITYKVVGTQVVLKKSAIQKKSIEKISFAGQGPALVSNKNQKEMISDTSIEMIIPPVDSAEIPASAQLIPPPDSVINPGTMTYRKVSGKDKKTLDREYLLARKELREQYYRLSDSLNVEDKNNGKIVKANLNKLLLTIQKEISRISDTLQVHNEQKKLVRQEVVDSVGYVYRPLQISFVSLLGTNGMESGRTVNNVSLNIIGGYSAGVEGVEVASIYNLENDYMHGSQFAGIANMVKKDVTGTQIAGVLNVNGGLTNAVQLAGVMNRVDDTLRGFQGAGLLNIVKGNAEGTQFAGLINITGHAMEGAQFAGLVNNIGDSAGAVQFAGLMNVVSNKLTGFQAAGLGNVTKGDLTGTQVSGLFNVAKKVKGSQIGIINIADTVSGVQLGLLSFSKRGYRRLEVFGAEAILGNIAFKMGTHKFYNIFSLGGKVSGNDFTWTAGLGFGTHFKFSNNIGLSLDAICNQVNEQEVWTKDKLNLMNQLKLTIGIKIYKNVELFAGPVWNVMVSNRVDKDGTIGSKIAPWTSYRHLSGNTSITMWPGLNVGLRF